MMILLAVKSSKKCSFLKLAVLLAIPLVVAASSCDKVALAGVALNVLGTPSLLLLAVKALLVVAT